MRCVQGVAASPYHAQSAMHLTFSQVVLEEWFIKEKVDREFFIYSSFGEFLKYFLDDVLIYSDLEKGNRLHFLCIDAAWYALDRAGWNINIKKCNFLTNTIKFLGGNLNAKEGVAEVSLDRAEAIIEARCPRSCAEASSRASMILYNLPFLPFLKKLLLPIHKMITGGEFYWNKSCAESYNEIKLLMALKMKNFPSHFP